MKQDYSSVAGSGVGYPNGMVWDKLGQDEIMRLPLCFSSSFEKPVAVERLRSPVTIYLWLGGDVR